MTKQCDAYAMLTKALMSFENKTRNSTDFLYNKNRSNELKV